MHAYLQRILRTTVVLIVLALFPSGRAAEPVPLPAGLEDVRRIVFLGDSITYAGHYVTAIDTYHATRFPERPIEMINVGLSSETTSGLSEPNHAGGRYRRPDVHERVGRVLEKIRPDLVIVCYGMNDGIYHPPSDEILSAFQGGMTRLHDRVTAAGARVIHVTPPVFDPIPIPGRVTNAGPYSFSRPHEDYDLVLGGFSNWLMGRRAVGWDVVDLHGAMKSWLAERRVKDPDFACSADGVHPDAAGHWIMAKRILLHLGARDVADAGSVEAMLSAHANGLEVLKLVREKQELLRDAWLTETGHTRPGVKAGLPLAEAKAQAAELDRRIRELARSGSDPAPIVDFIPGNTPDR